MWRDIFRDIARRSANNGRLPDPRPELLAEIWPVLVGESLAAMSEPTALNERTLHVSVRNEQLAREWKHSSLALLRRVRRFSPWSIETLEIAHDPRAGVTPPKQDRRTDADHKDCPPDRAGPAPEALDDTEGIDDELQSLIEAIHHHRLQRED